MRKISEHIYKDDQGHWHINQVFQDEDAETSIKDQTTVQEEAYWYNFKTTGIGSGLKLQVEGKITDTTQAITINIRKLFGLSVDVENFYSLQSYFVGYVQASNYNYTLNVKPYRNSIVADKQTGDFFKANETFSIEAFFPVAEWISKRIVENTLELDAQD